MDFGDLIFYGIIAISVVSSVVKAVKKKPDGNMNTGMPDFKGSRAGDLIRRVLNELDEKDDEYIPKNQKPVQSLKKEPALVPKLEPMKPLDLVAEYQKTRYVTETMPRREYFRSHSKGVPEVVPEELSDPVLQTLNLNQADELKKAILYSEILKPKF